MYAAQVHQFGDPEVIKVEKISIPKPSLGQILVKVHAAGVNPVDTYIRSGRHNIKPEFPFTLGFDGAGTVEDIGDLVTKFKRGDHVYFHKAVTGSYAEYAVVDEINSFPLPSNIGFVEGAGLGIPYFTAYRSIVHKCNAKPGEIMLVHGASGAVGLACCQIGKAMGLKVFGTAGTEEGLDIVLQNGAHAVFNHNESDYFDKILQASGGEGVDLIMEMIANKNLEKDFLLSKAKARIVVIGARDVTEITPRHILYKELQVFGVFLFLATKEELDEMGAYIFSGLEQGYLWPITGQQFALNDAAKAHHEVIEHPHGTKGKIVLKIV